MEQGLPPGDWLRDTIDILIAIAGGISAGAFFLGFTKHRIQVLEAEIAVARAERTKLRGQVLEDRDSLRVELLQRIDASDDQLHKDVRDAVHDLLNRLSPSVGAAANKEDIKRLEAHLARQDERIDRLLELVTRARENWVAPRNG